MQWRMCFAPAKRVFLCRFQSLGLGRLDRKKPENAVILDGYWRPPSAALYQA